MDLRVQLKVCEGCGCLWYRAHTHCGVYCLGCELKLKEFPSARSRRRRGPRQQAFAGAGVDRGRMAGGGGESFGSLLSVWAVAEAAGGAE